jgi:chorismate-pyruvate lyase
MTLLKLLALSSIASLAVLGTEAGRLRAQESPRWPDTPVVRLEALALLQTLNADILASRSATRTLESWCGAHHLAPEARLVAQLLPESSRPLSDEQRRRLQLGDNGEVKYRRVQLRCGSHVLSEADNWYVPARLTPEMNRLLETTDTPFGRVVESLEPYRRTFAVKMLWAPLPADWESARGRPQAVRSRGALAIPEALFEHHAVLYTSDNEPFAEVTETYRRDLLAFPPPVLR